MKYVCVLSLMVLLLSACNSDSDSAKQYVPENYTDWTMLSDGYIDVIIPGHGENIRRIFMNDTGKNVTVTENEDDMMLRHEYPDGTIIVKEEFNSPVVTNSMKAFKATVMIKDRDHPAAEGGWLWLVKDLETGDETLVTEGNLCFSCHKSANEAYTVFGDDTAFGNPNPDGDFRDYVFFSYRGNN